MAEKKVHFGKDCSTYGWHATARIETDIRRVTCGQCKQTILRVLLFADWSKLPESWIAVLTKLAEVAFDPTQDPGHQRGPRELPPLK